MGFLRSLSRKESSLMNAWSMIRSLNPQQRTTFLGSFLGWPLDAFDFFLLTFVPTRVAPDLHIGLPAVALTLTLTLLSTPLRPLTFAVIPLHFGLRLPL